MAVKSPNDGEAVTWGSHQPALRAIAQFLPIRSVIEFGAGFYSTPLFLDREAFPLLESLVTFENEWDWANSLRTNDPRHTMVITTTKRFIPHSTGMRADFVFIDSADAGGRVELMPHALTIAPLFAIHDCQVIPPWASELDHLGAKYVRGFNSAVQTVFASNTIDLSGLRLPS